MCAWTIAFHCGVTGSFILYGECWHGCFCFSSLCCRDRENLLIAREFIYIPDIGSSLLLRVIDIR